MDSSTNLIRNRRRTVVCGIAILLLALAGCAGISVERVVPGLFDSFRFSATTAGDLAPRTWQTLRQWDLDQLYREHPDQAVAELQQIAESNPEPDYLFALAEICY